MTQITSRIQGSFYALQREEWLKACRELKHSERCVLYYIKAIDPNLNGIEINVAQIARELSSEKRMVHRQTVSRAIKELVAKSYLPKCFIKSTPCEDKERRIRDRLKLELGGQVEVSTAVGRIDLLTATEVIEIKNIKDWKGALGQILAYSAFFPKHSKRIHLFGKANLARLATCQATCSEFGITVTFEEVQ